MRCSVCDWSGDTPSEYYEGLHLHKSRYTRIKKDHKTDRYICSLCWDSVDEAYREFEYIHDDDKLDFNSPPMSLREQQ